MMRSDRRILSSKFSRQGFEVIHQIRWESGKPTERPFLEKGGENLVPHDLVYHVEVHLCLENVQVLVWVCGTVIEPDSQSLPFEGELCFHYFICKRMCFWILVVISRRGPFGSHGALMSLRSRLLLLFGSVESLLQLFALLLDKEHLFFVPPLIFHAFFTHLLHLRLECLN